MKMIDEMVIVIAPLCESLAAEAISTLNFYDVRPPSVYRWD